MNVLYKYAIAGILKSNIREDGGQECYQQIPAKFAIIAGLASTLINIVVFMTMRNSVQSKSKEIGIKPKLWEKLIGILSIVTVIVQGYYKFKTQKGLFMLNPCHINLLMLTYLLFAQTSASSKKMYICWETWLFGPVLSLVFPHLNGIDSQFEIFLYYLEHLLIIPIGPLILLSRYGLPTPTLFSQIFGFTTTNIYQYAVLLTCSRLTKVNLNFTLCHSPADPGFDLFGYKYLLYGSFYLNVFSYMTRLMIYPFRWIVMKLKGEDRDNVKKE